MLFALACLGSVNAQSLVRAGIHLGGNLSQLDGDTFEGFHKTGLRFGLRSETRLRPQLDLVIEINYEDKGSFVGSHAQNNKDRDKTVKLEYAEIPIMLRYAPFKHIPAFAEAGASVAYLFRDRLLMEADDPHRLEVRADRDLYRRSELNLLLGAGWVFGDKIQLMVRYSYGVQALVRDQEGLNEYHRQLDGEDTSTTVPVFHLRNYQISFGIGYMLVGGSAMLAGEKCPSVF